MGPKEVKLPDGVTCVGALYRGGFVDQRGAFTAIYVFVYEGPVTDSPDGSGAKTQQWENFYAFTFGNAVKLWASLNPDFFTGTVVEKEVKHYLEKNGNPQPS